MSRRFLSALLVLAAPAFGRSRLEALFENLPADSGRELLEARYNLVHLVLIPTANGFYFEPSREPDALEQAEFSLERAKLSEVAPGVVETQKSAGEDQVFPGHRGSTSTALVPGP